MDEPSEKEPHFKFRYMAALIDSGLLLKLSLKELRIMFVHLDCAGPKGESFPSPERIAKGAGVSVRTVHRIRNVLKDRCLLVLDKLGGGCTKGQKGLPSVWRLVIPEAVTKVGDFDTASGIKAVSDSRVKLCQNQGGKLCQKAGVLAQEQVTEQIKEQSSSSPPVASARTSEEQELVKLLLKRGVWQESARGLVARGLSRQDANRIWAEVVNDKSVKMRDKAYFRRLERRLAAGGAAIQTKPVAPKSEEPKAQATKAAPAAPDIVEAEDSTWATRLKMSIRKTTLQQPVIRPARPVVR